jgi:hypothetical protein
VPGKTYEYLGSGRPILSMGPPGDMRKFVQETHSGVTIEGSDTAGATAALVKFYQNKINGNTVFEQDRASVARFERRQLTARLAEELDALTAK